MWERRNLYTDASKQTVVVSQFYYWLHCFRSLPGERNQNQGTKAPNKQASTC